MREALHESIRFRSQSMTSMNRTIQSKPFLEADPESPSKLKMSVIPKVQQTNENLQTCLIGISDLVGLDQTYQDFVNGVIKKCKDLGEKSILQQKYSFGLYSSLMSRNIEIRNHIMQYIAQMKVKGKYTAQAIIKNNPPATLFRPKTNEGSKPRNHVRNISEQIPVRQVTNKTVYNFKVALEIPKKTTSNLLISRQKRDNWLETTVTNSTTPVKHSILVKKLEHRQDKTPPQSDKSSIVQQNANFVSHLREIPPKFPNRYQTNLRIISTNGSQTLIKKSFLLNEPHKTLHFNLDGENSRCIHKRFLKEKIDKDIYYKILSKIYDRNVATFL